MSSHANMPHQENCVCGQVSSSTRYMRANHCNKAIGLHLRFEQVGGGEFRMVCHRVGTTHFKLDPQSTCTVLALKHHIGTGRITQQFAKRGTEYVDFTIAAPALWATRP